MTLDLLPVGATGEIVAIDENRPNLARLAELGLIAGQKVYLIKKAPLGDPLQIRVMNYELCIRKEDAAGISVHATREADSV